jgi:SAM-dependent methyltransferase
MLSTGLDLWDYEYGEIHSIPSSTRMLPSKALLMAEPLINIPRLKTVLDAGCGNGRNALHLANRGIDVIAADFSPVALRMVQTLNSGLVRPIRLNLNATFPFRDKSFDCCIDSYVSCHFTDEGVFDRYWNELARVTVDEGYLYTSMFSIEDEYYRHEQLKQGARSRLVTDHVNGITKRLYDELEFKELFGERLDMTNFFKFEFFDNVFGSNYRRSLFVAVLRKSHGKRTPL